MLKYASVCSGIEAATVAWKHMNWEAVWLSEIETFPCEVLKHHYPDTPNLGDMTKLKNNDIYEQSTFDVLVGGTPCQSFSIAGLRGGMADERGNLALEYCRILIDKSPRWFVWENVPGVFSSFSDAEGSKVIERDGGERGDGDCITETSDFATLLTAFRECGYSCAWRVFDSRHFGVPQRRRRVFVVGYLGGDWRPPVAVLFERESLRRDFTPSRKTRKATTTSTIAGTQGGDINCQPNGISGAMTSKWAKGTGGPAGDEHYNLIVQPQWWDGGQLSHTLTKNSENQRMPDKGNLSAVVVPVAYGIQANIVNRTEKSGGNGLGVKEEEAPTLTKNDQHCVMQPIVIDRAAFNQGVNAKYDAQIEHTETALCLLKSGPHAVMTPQTIDCRNLELNEEISGTLQSKKTGGYSLNYVNPVIQPIILDNQGGNVMTVYDQGHVGTLRAQTHGHEPIVMQPTPCYVDDMRRGLEVNKDISPTVLKFWGTGGGNTPFVQQSMVRRLTPLECCRLQGFPDDYMDGVPNASDSKWYAAFGNTMTIQVVKWIGERIDKVDKLITKLNSK